MPFANNSAKFATHDEERLVRVCPSCGARFFERVFPLKAEYLGGAPNDFNLCGAQILVRSEVGEELASKFQGVEVRQIEIYQGVSLWSASEKKPLMAKKYKRPELAELWFPFVVPANPELSKLQVWLPAKCCVEAKYIVKGVEKVGVMETDPGEIYEEGYNYNRRPEMGIRIPTSELLGNEAFVYMAGRLMILERVKRYIEESGWENIQFIDYGEMI